MKKETRSEKPLQNKAPGADLHFLLFQILLACWPFPQMLNLSCYVPIITNSHGLWQI